MLLRNFEAFRTTDPEEAIAHVSERRTEVRDIAFAPGAKWKFVVNWIKVGSIVINSSNVSGASYRIDQSENCILATSLSGREIVTVGDESRVLQSEVMFMPASLMSSRIDHAEFGTAMLNRGKLTEVLRSLESDVDVKTFLETNWLTSLAGATVLQDALRYVLTYVDTFGHPAGITERALEDLLYAHAAQSIAGGRGTEVRPENPRAFQRCLDFIDAQVSADISVLDVAAAAGLSLRGVQALFQRHAGTSITRFVRHRRLAFARAMLESPRAPETVMAVSVAAGFNQLSYFNRSYRAAFGETPGETLRRARSRT